MLSSQPESWATTVTTIRNSSAKTKLCFDEVRESESGSTSGSALNTKDRGRSKNMQIKIQRKKSARKDKDTIECWNCDKFGHYRSQCTTLKKNKKGQNEKEITNATTYDIGDSLNNSRMMKRSNRNQRVKVTNNPRKRND